MDSIGRRVQARIYREGVFGRKPVVPVEVGGLEARAQQVMSREAWSYVAGSAGQHRTDAANRAAFDRYRIVPRMLVNVEQRDLGVDLFGRRLEAPILLAPIGVLEMAHPQAEQAVAQAARAVGTPMVISTQGSVPMERTAEALGDTGRWYQLYWSRNDDLVASFVERAEAIGSEAIVVTLDTAFLGWRTRDLDCAYLPFARGEGIAQYTSDPVFKRLVDERVHAGREPGAGGEVGGGAEARAQAQAEPTPRPTFAAIRALVSMAQHWPGSTFSNLRSPHPRAAVETFLDVFSRPSLNWSDLSQLRALTSLPIVLKGIQHPDDAQRALDHGVDGIIVSNHGGRQVDGAIGSLDALVSVAPVVGGRVPLLFDSGIRSGADVYKAVALGADAVLVGRPYVYGLALAGAAGVQAVLEHIIAELDLTMALAGATSLSDVRALGLNSSTPTQQGARS